MPVIGVLGFVQDQLGRGPAELASRLAHRAERHRGGRREVDVVVPDDGELVGDGDPQRDALLEQPQRQQVVGAERGGGPQLRGHAGQPLTGGPALVDRERCGLDDDQVRRAALPLSHRLPGSVQPVAHLPERARPADERDPLVALLEQVRDGQPSTEVVVDGDRAQVADLRGPVDQDDGRAQLGRQGQVGGVRVERGDQDALDPLLLQPVQVVELSGGTVVAVAHEDRHLRFLGRLFDPLGDIGEERVRGVEEDIGQRPAGAAPQLPRLLVADEAQVGHRLFDPAAGRGGNLVGLVHHVGDRPERDARQPGDILHAGLARAAGPPRGRRPRAGVLGAIRPLLVRVHQRSRARD